jgi:hypothetical protein
MTKVMGQKDCRFQAETLTAAPEKLLGQADSAKQGREARIGAQGGPIVEGFTSHHRAAILRM